MPGWLYVFLFMYYIGKTMESKKKEKENADNLTYHRQHHADLADNKN